MRENSDKKGTDKRFSLFVSILVIFCIFGCVVFFVSRRISREMSTAAIQNLNEKLDLVKCTIESIWKNGAEFQKLMAQELAEREDLEEYIRSYQRNQSMVKISLIRAGETKGISSTGESFSRDSG